MVLAGGWHWSASPVRGAESTNVFLLRAEQAYQAARARQAADPTNDVPAWQLGRACFDRAEHARNDPEREQLALEGIAACRAVVARSPQLAAGHYYLAMNLGQLARTRTLGALPLVREMETVFQQAARLDPNFDYAGPDRCLGILYFEAPGWPTSIGSRSKARVHLERCVALSPDYPDNQLSLMEALLKWKERRALAKAVEDFGRRLPLARETLTGERWEESWGQWNRRWEALQKRVTP